MTLTAAFIAEAEKRQNRPCELYDIYLGSQDACDGMTYHFCTDNARVNFFDPDGNPQVYLPLSIDRQFISNNSDMSVDSVSGDFDNGDLAWSQWIGSPEVGDIRGKRTVMRRVFLDLLSDAANTKILMDGILAQVAEISFKKVTIAIRSTMICLSINTGQLQGIDCPYMFGDEDCGINNSPLANQVVDAGCTATEIIDAARTEADDYWKDGFIVMTSGQNNGQERHIVGFDQATNKLTLDYSLPYAPAAGNTYDIRRGCDQSYDTCKDKFNNNAVFGGCKDTPLLIN